MAGLDKAEHKEDIKKEDMGKMNMKEENENNNFLKLMLSRGLKSLIFAIVALIFVNISELFLSGYSLSFCKAGFTLCGIVLLVVAFIHLGFYIKAYTSKN